MTAKQNIDLAKAILDVVEKDLTIADGAIVFTSVQNDLKLLQDIEAAFKAAGYTVPANVDKILEAAVSLTALFGVK